MDVSIILVNYNTKALTTQCIVSVMNKTKTGLVYEIIVVDNASVDGSQEALSEINNIKLVLSEENLGFGRGNNLGVQHASGEILFFLNSDTILIENSIQILYDFFIQHEQKLSIGTLGCVLVDKHLQPNGSSFEYTTVAGVIKDTIGAVTRRVIKKPPVPSGEVYFEVDYVIGADIMMRKSVFEKENGFDPAFFMYFEEAELQKRIQRNGLKSYINTQTRIIHLEGGSTDTNRLTNKRRIMIQKGRNLFLKKSQPGSYWLYVLFDSIYSLFRLLNRNFTFSENVEFLKQNFKSY